MHHKLRACSECNAPPIPKADLEAHIIQTHFRTNPVCNICAAGKLYTDLKLLNKHVAYAHQSSPPLLCHVKDCRKSTNSIYKVPYQLHCHINKWHGYLRQERQSSPPDQPQDRPRKLRGEQHPPETPSDSSDGDSLEELSGSLGEQDPNKWTYGPSSGTFSSNPQLPPHLRPSMASNTAQRPASVHDRPSPYTLPPWHPAYQPPAAHSAQQPPSQSDPPSSQQPFGQPQQPKPLQGSQQAPANRRKK